MRNGLVFYFWKQFCMAIIVAHVSKDYSNCQKQVVLLMILNGDGWQD